MTRIAPRSLVRASAAFVFTCLPLATYAQTAPAYPGVAWESWSSPAAAGMDLTRIQEAITYSEGAAIAPESGGSGYIARGGKHVRHWGSLTALHEVKSVTKSIGSAALAFAMQDRGLTLADLARTHLATMGVPPDTNSADWLSAITIEQLATHSAGFDKPGGLCNLLTPSGTRWSYSDCGINWLADVLTTLFQEDLYTLLDRRVFTPIGIGAADLAWRDNSTNRGTTINGLVRRELASGINARVEALARIGLLFARDGLWAGGQRILPEGFVARVSQPAPSIAGLPIEDPGAPPRYPGASAHYGLLWWNNGDGRLANVPRDAFWGWGLTDDLLVVIPSLDLVIVRIGEAWWRTQQGDPLDCQTQFCTDYTVLEPFIGKIVESVTNASPVVDAGADQAVTVSQGATLSGTITDGGAPFSGTASWTLVSPASGASIATPNQASAKVSFTAPGTYVFELDASDGAFAATNLDRRVTVTVNADAAAPTVTLSANPGTLTAGATTRLTWSSGNATSCTASGAWSGSKATSGAEDSAALQAGTSTFVLACSGAGGSTQQSASVTVNAPPPPAPAVSLSASAASVSSGGNATLTWSSTNATGCTASGGWTGAKATSGSETVGPISQNTTYTLACSGAGGSDQKSVTVDVAAAPQSSGGGGSGGGGGALDGLLLSALAAAVGLATATRGARLAPRRIARRRPPPRHVR